MKYIIFILITINSLAFRPIFAQSSLEYKPEYKDTRIYFENQMYKIALEDKLKEDNLTEIEINYLLEEIKKSDNRSKNLDILAYEQLSFSNNIENIMYENILNKKFVEKNQDTYKFYENFILDNLDLIRKFDTAPNQIKVFPGKNEVLGNDFEGKIILTFDDGPSKYTTDIISTLEKNQISAIFFVLENRINSHEKILENMIKDGYIIGIHSNTHPNLIKLGNEEIEVEVSSGQKKLMDMFSYESIYFRSPYGSRNEETLDIINKYYENHILWNIDSIDWHKNFTKEIIVERVIRLNYLLDGGIVLFHDINNKSPFVIDEIIKKLKKGGFVFTNKI